MQPAGFCPTRFMKSCLECGGPLIKRAHESNKRFGKKQFCSAHCSRGYLKKNKKGWWSPENKGQNFDYYPCGAEEL